MSFRDSELKETVNTQTREQTLAHLYKEANAHPYNPAWEAIYPGAVNVEDGYILFDGSGNAVYEREYCSFAKRMIGQRQCPFLCRYRGCN